MPVRISASISRIEGQRFRHFRSITVLDTIELGANLLARVVRLDCNDELDRKVPQLVRICLQ